MPVSARARMLVVDARPEGECGGLGEALRGREDTVRASCAETALPLAESEGLSVAVVHAGLDAGPKRRPGGVILAVELARRLPELSVLLVGAARDLWGWSLLHEMGATARFLPDSAPAKDCERLLQTLVEEVAARRGIADVLHPLAHPDDRKLEELYLGRFLDDVERGLIGTAVQVAPSTHDAAALLGLREGGMRARMRKLGMRLGPRPSAPSTRDRILVVGAGPASRGFAFGRASCAADARCLSLGGAGQGPSAPQAIALRDVICSLEGSLKAFAIAQEPTRAKAAELLHISVRALYRRRKARRRPDTPK